MSNDTRIDHDPPGNSGNPDFRNAVDVAELGDAVTAWSTDDVPLLFIQSTRDAFPSVEATIAWASAHRAELDRLILNHAGILLRGFPISTPQQFDAFIGVFPAYQAGYVGGGAPRKRIEGKVLESTRYDENIKIPLHSEMAYLKSYPPRIAFFCKRASPVGGETIIGSMKEFMRLLPDDLREKLEHHDIHVVRNFAPAGSTGDVVTDSDKIGWDDAFNTDRREEVEAHCHRLEAEATWNPGGGLTIVNVMKAFTDHVATGERFYRSHIHSGGRVSAVKPDAEISTPQHRASGYSFENGEALSSGEASVIQSIFSRIERSFPWHDSDIMILDNLQVAHGRNPFSGKREVMVALLE